MSGFTMVELLITAAIVAVSLLAIATIFPTAMGNINRGGEETAALTVAQGFSELVRGIDWDTLSQFNGFDTKKKSACPSKSAQVKAMCDAWVEQVTGNPSKGIRGLADGQATITVATQPSVNPNLKDASKLATVTISVTFTQRSAWLNTSRREILLVTRKSQT